MAIITISRGTFSGGQQLAECVAEKLGYRCVSREVLLKAASEYGVPEEELSRALSKKPGILERLTSERDQYLAYIKAALFNEAKNDNLVYHGHAGHLLLERVPHVLRVRIIANIEFRIKALSDHHSLNRNDALEFIERVDEERIEWTRFLYHIDWRDPAIYDLVINFDRMTLHGACEIVCHAARLDPFKSTPISQKLVDDLALSNHVVAILAADRNIVTDGIKIESDRGVVTIEGIAKWVDDIPKIEKTVSMVPGVYKVISNIQRAPSWAEGEGLRIK
jgi:cytidylate kinase